jgi:hypothetical protein
MSNSNLPVPSGQNKMGSTIAAGNIFKTRQVALSPMHYNTRVTSSNPCAMVLLLDHSGSMSEVIKDNRGNEKEKAKTLAISVNKFFEEIILTCQKTDLIKDYFEILVISYGKMDEDSESIVSLAWEGVLEGRSWVSVNELRNSSLRKDFIEVPNAKSFGPKFLKEEQNIWIEPYAEGLTPMKEAFEVCNKYVQQWVMEHPHSFPPMVFNITDGAASDVENFDELIESAEKIKANSTSDGNTLLFNLLLLSNNEQVKEFPLFSERHLFEDNEYDTALFDASSTIPENLKKALPVNRNAPEEVKALVLGNLEMILSFLNIGTSTLRNNTQ